MSLLVKADDLPEIHDPERPLETKVAHGKTMNLMYAVRDQEYHSPPHIHKAEQLNYCLEGKIWMFVEDKAYLMEPGDFSRIPAMAVHWSKVEEGPCVVIESHSPPLTKNMDSNEAVGLFEEDEAGAEEEVANIWVSESYAENEEEMMDAYRANSN